MRSLIARSARPRRRPAPPAPSRRLFLAVALGATLLGCASTIPPESEAPDDTGPEARRWSCDALEGKPSEPWASGLKTWHEEGGTLSSVHGTLWGHAGVYGRSTRDEAVREALGSAASAALDLLERRGLSYGSERRAEIEERTVETFLEGGEPAFPRVRVAGKVVEHCRDEETGEDAWRARLLVEYPVGELRGDVVNATWERERLLREIEIFRASAAAHFEDGRWLDGRLDLKRARDLVFEVGVSLPEVTADVDPSPRWGSPDATQAERVWWHAQEIRSTRAPLSVEPSGGIDVVEIGAHARAEAAFLVTYTWNGARTPAVGVPMRYEVDGHAAVILDGDPVTDEDGIARCRILRAYGAPGEYRLVAAVDADLVRSAGVSEFGDVVVEVSHPDGEPTTYKGGPAASQKLFLVSGGHGVTICVEFTGDRERDASQARAGFVQRMANDGFHAEPCGPDVDVVVSAEIGLITVVVPGSWTAEVTIDGSAFDQRFAREIGGTGITITETSTEGQRDAELRALREAGRLLAVYLSGRILTSGG